MPWEDHKTHVRTSEIFSWRSFQNLRTVFLVNYVYSSSSIPYFWMFLYLYKLRARYWSLKQVHIRRVADFIDKFRVLLKSHFKLPCNLAVYLNLFGWDHNDFLFGSLLDALTIRHRIAQYMNINFRACVIFMSAKGGRQFSFSFF